MRSETYLFTINGKPLLAPDGDVAITYSDIDGSDAGRDQNGRLHRSVVRYKVASWELTYSHLSDEEKRYLESLFPDSPTFLFGHPSRQDPGILEETECYRSQYGIHYRNAHTGLWSDLRFSIIEV